MLQIQWGGLHTIISGGQTGADQGGLLAARSMRVQTGGVAPSQFRTSTGSNPLLKAFGLTAKGDLRSRTRENIQSSSGTAILSHDLSSPGSRLTLTLCREAAKPVLCLDLSALIRLMREDTRERIDDATAMILQHAAALVEFVLKNRITTLNIAGNREISHDGQSGGRLLMTTATEIIVGTALHSLKESGKLIQQP